MTIIDMFGQSGVLTVLGMAVVFSFLLILVITVTLAGKVIRRFGFDKDQAQASPAGTSAGMIAGTGAESGTIAANSAAVNEYRKTDNQG